MRSSRRPNHEPPLQTFIILIEFTSILYYVTGNDDNLRIVVISCSYVIVDCSDWKG